jgi:glycosyltransferase involved in cell wall biosynthesis
VFVWHDDVSNSTPTQMKILLSARHRYPAGGFTGKGIHANPRTTGGAAFIHDHLAKGLAELGHEVYYHLASGYDPPLPEGVRPTELRARGMDILHQSNSQFLHVDWTLDELAELKAPWVSTCHIDLTMRPDPPAGYVGGKLSPNWIVVSETLASLYGHRRCVVNGVDPAALIFSTAKADYLLFVGRADVADQKGLALALALSSAVGFPLTIMATSTREEVMRDLDARCRDAGARFVGDARGQRKAELIAGARALLFPTSLNEGCPLVIAESLMSGTPVVTSHMGACAEMVVPGVGFVCNTWDDYVQAIGQISSIKPEECRRHALDQFHYLKMARAYAQEYQAEVELYHSDPRCYFDRTTVNLHSDSGGSPGGALRPVFVS